MCATITKYPTGQFTKNGNLFVTVLRAKKCKTKASADSISTE